MALSDIVGEGCAGETFVSPRTQEEVAAVLAYAGPAGLRFDSRFELRLDRLNRILEYNAADLTMSVEAGATFATLDAALAAHQQWLPLGVPRPDRTTVSAALTANLSGPFRLFYGTARDMVIGIRFATTEGKLVKSGGKVVKNVAGYDLAKMLIGSAGTLAAITQVNFKVFPIPRARETTAMGFDTAAAALAARTAIQKSALTPLAMDLLNAEAARIVSPQELPPGAWILVVAYGGLDQVIERYRREIAAMARAHGARASATLSGHDEARLWRAVCDLPAHMEEHAKGALRIRAASTIAQVGACIEAVPADAVVARAGTGVTYFYAQPPDVAGYLTAARRVLAPLGVRAVVEYSPIPLSPLDRWGPPGDDFPVMQQLKQALDPGGILNAGSFVGGI